MKKGVWRLRAWGSPAESREPGCRVEDTPETHFLHRVAVPRTDRIERLIGDVGCVVIGLTQFKEPRLKGKGVKKRRLLSGIQVYGSKLDILHRCPHFVDHRAVIIEDEPGRVSG